MLKKVVLIIILITSFFAVLNFDNLLKIKKENKPQFSLKTFPNYPLTDLWGDPAPSMFPDISKPKYVSSKEAEKFLRDDDDVYLFQKGEKIYVYPSSILGYHHIVNDIIDTQPVAITLCLLSDSALVFSRNIDGQTLSFGVLGPLFYGNLVIYDKQSNSYWYQLTGKSFRGEFNNKKLDFLGALERTTFEKIKNLDNIVILSPERDIAFYQKFYKKYSNSTIGQNSLKGKKIDNRENAYESGLGIAVNNDSKFYPLSQITKNKVINDSLGGWGIVLALDKNNNSQKIFRRFVKNKILTFKAKENYIVDEQTNTKWDFNGYGFEGPLKGNRLQAPYYSRIFWFSWSSFFPKTQIFKN